MDRTPPVAQDSDGQDDLYPGAFPRPDRPDQAADPARGPQGADSPAADAPPPDDAPPEDWRDQIERERQAREAAERQIQEHNRLLAQARQLQEDQQRTTLAQQKAIFRQQLRNGDLTQEQIDQAFAYFDGVAEQRAKQAEERYQQVEHRQNIAGYKQHVIQHFGLTPDEVAELESFDDEAPMAPNAYWKAGEILARQRTKFAAVNQRLSALERDYDAETRLTSRVDRPGPAGPGAGAPRDQGDPSSEDAYLSIPWQRRA